MGKFQLNKKGEDPLKIYEDTFKIANDTVETHLDKLGKMPNPISSESQSQCPACKGVGCGVCDQSGFVSREDYDKMKKIFESKANEVTAEDIVNKLNSNLSSDYYPRKTSHVREIEDLGDGEVRFGYSGGVIDDEIERMFRASGFRISNIRNIMDAGHLDAEGKLGESIASEWESVEAIASEYTSHKYDQEIKDTIDNIAKKQAEYTRECPDGCGKKFNTIDDNAVAYHLYNDHGYSSEDSMKSAGLESHNPSDFP